MPDQSHVNAWRAFQQPQKVSWWVQVKWLIILFPSLLALHDRGRWLAGQGWGTEPMGRLGLTGWLYRYWSLTHAMPKGIYFSCLDENDDDWRLIDNLAHLTASSSITMFSPWQLVRLVLNELHMHHNASLLFDILNKILKSWQFLERVMFFCVYF